MNLDPPHGTQPGMTARAANTETDVSRSIAEMAAALQAVLAGLGETLERARQPGRPLATISTWTRKAPLASLLGAFLLGVVVARRR